MNPFFHSLGQASLQAAALVILIALARFAIPGASARWRLAMGSLVLIRLLMPATPSSRFSLQGAMNVAGGWLATPIKQTPAVPRAQAVFTTTPRPTEVSEPITVVQSGILLPGVSTAMASPTRIENKEPITTTRHRFLFIAWSLGFAACVIRAAVLTAKLLRRIRNSIVVADPAILALLESCCREMRITRPPLLRITDAVHSPALIGWLRPTLLLPPDFLESTPRAQIRLAFLHELAHVRGRDVPVNWLWSIAAALHWFNPLAWVAMNQWRADREEARDAAVLRAVGNEHAESYASMLVNLVGGASIPFPAGVGMASGYRQIRRRIVALLQEPHRPTFRSRAAWVLLPVIGCASLTGADKEKAGSINGSPVAMVTQTYDVHELLIQVPNFENAPSLSLPAEQKKSALFRTAPPEEVDRSGQEVSPIVNGPNGEQSVHNAPRKNATTVEIDGFISILKATVDPKSWETGATIRLLAGQLIILQTPANHEAIQRLVNTLREDRKTQISIETRLVQFNDAEPGIQKNLRDKFESSDQPEKLHTGVLLDDVEVNKLLRASQGSAKLSLVTAPRVTTFNGQRTYVLVVHQRSYIADYTVVYSKNGNPLFNPRVETVSAGSGLDIQAAASIDRKSISLSIRAQFSTLEGLIDKPFDGGPKDQKLVIQQPILSLSQVLVNTNIGDGRTMLFRFEDGSQPDFPGATTKPVSTTRPSGRQYLLVKASIVRQQAPATQAE